MNILFYTHLCGEFPHLLDNFSNDWKSHSFIIATSREEYEANLADSHILIASNPTRKEIERAVKLKLLIIPFAGIGHIDFPLLEERGILLANSHGNAQSVAERALALTLSLCGKIPLLDRDMRRGDWHLTGNRHSPYEYWYSLSGKNISLLGGGAVARALTTLIRPFGGEILALKRDLTDHPFPFDRVTNDLKEAFSFSDLLVLTLPLTDETKGILNSSNLSRWKNKFIINVGRGELIEEKALYEALKEGKIKGAAIDTWYDYPTKEKPSTIGTSYPLDTFENVIFSPHASSNCKEGKEGQLRETLDVLRSFLEGKDLKNRIEGTY